jgi:hypothetical protein
MGSCVIDLTFFRDVHKRLSFGFLPANIMPGKSFGIAPEKKNKEKPPFQTFSE